MSKILEDENQYIGKYLLVPMLENSKKDYKIYKDIMTDPYMMKSVSLFNQNIPFLFFNF
jgi:hypothetical protein